MSDDIIKVQIPLFGNETEGCLIYDSLRQHTSLQDISQEVRDALGGDLKGYFEGQWNSDAQEWTIGARVADQVW